MRKTCFWSQFALNGLKFNIVLKTEALKLNAAELLSL